MSNRFYKTRKNRLVAGVVAGLADKFGWDLALARILAIILMVSTQFGIFLYLVLAFLLPYKEDIYPEIKLKDGRKRKNAEPVEDEWNWWVNYNRKDLWLALVLVIGLFCFENRIENLFMIQWN